MSKYIDLANQIFGETNTVYLADIKETLRWLDEKPANLPGRTITRSEMRERMNENFTTKVRSIDVEAYTESLGRIVVPDPEPTNAELIDRAYELWDMYPQDETFGEYLDRHGWTKAPEAGGDDDQ